MRGADRPPSHRKMVEMSKRISRFVIETLRADLQRLLASTEEFVKRSENAASPEEAKHWLRRAHDAQRQERLIEARQFIELREDNLITHFADGSEVDPAKIDPVVTPVITKQHSDLWHYASLTWSVPVSQGYGRRTKFIVRDRQNEKLIAIFALGDPVIGLNARDKEIGWTTEQRHARLYNVYDAFVLGAIEPYRQLLAGKLVALLAISNESRRFLTEKYSGTSTVIRGESKNPAPALITTSSALGRSSVYNRLTFEGRRAFYSVGFTSGFGHFHIPEDMFQQMVLLTQATGKGQDGAFGKGANFRFRVIRHALTQLGLPSDGLRHGVRREVFLAPLAENWTEYLCGASDELTSFNMPSDDIADYYRWRWAIPRSERRQEFKSWSRDGMRLSNQLPSANIQYSLASAFDRAPLITKQESSMWSVGEVAADTSTTVVNQQGLSISGAVCDGTSRITEIRHGSISLKLGDTEWTNGERDIQAIDRMDSPGTIDSLIKRLRIGIYGSPLHEELVFMELRVALSDSSGRAILRKLKLTEIEGLLGVSLRDLLPRSKGILVGTREELFEDESRRRSELCVMFPKSDQQTPIRVWVISRLLTFLASQENSLTQGPRSRKKRTKRATNRRFPKKARPARGKRSRRKKS